MEELCIAIMQRWDSDAGGQAKEYIPAGLWFQEAPQQVLDSGQTYCVFFLMTGVTSYTFGTTIENPMVQFSIYATSEESSESVGPVYMARDAFVRVYDQILLSMQPDADGNTRRMIEMRREGHGEVVKDPDEGYACHLMYSCKYTFER